MMRQRNAAAVFAILGAIIALSAPRVTGNIVGISGANLLGLLAGAFFLASGALLGIKKKG